MHRYDIHPLIVATVAATRTGLHFASATKVVAMVALLIPSSSSGHLEATSAFSFPPRSSQISPLPSIDTQLIRVGKRHGSIHTTLYADTSSDIDRSQNSLVRTQKQPPATSPLKNFAIPTRSNLAKKKKPMPILGYNAEEICNHYDRSPLIVGWRLNSLSLPLLGEYTFLLQVMFIFSAPFLNFYLIPRV